jgi:hypothetical protein
MMIKRYYRGLRLKSKHKPLLSPWHMEGSGAAKLSRATIMVAIASTVQMIRTQVRTRRLPRRLMFLGRGWRILRLFGAFPKRTPQDRCQNEADDGEETEG